MPAQPTNRIGQTYGRFKIIQEAERGVVFDKGKQRNNIRRFTVECIYCNYETTSNWSIIRDQKIKCNCDKHNKVKIFDPELQKYHNSLKGFLEGKNGLKLIGQTVKNKDGHEFIVKEVNLPTRVYSFNTLYYKVECKVCGTEKQLQYAPLSQGRHWCRTCVPEKLGKRKLLFNVKERNIKTLRNKKLNQIEMWLNEMNAIWDQMMEMHKNGTLENYIMNKYGFTKEELEKIDL